MMKHLIKIALLLCMEFSVMPTYSQPEAYLSLDDEILVGTDYYFDIYLRTCSNSNGEIYVGNADFVIFFNEAIFINPVFTKVGASPGFCSFNPIDTSGSNTSLTRINYFDNSAVSIDGDKLIINLNGPTPSDQSAFNSRVARIDSLSSRHRLGRFMISGISDPSSPVGLSWKTGGNGIITKLFTLANTPPFSSSQVSLQLDTEICPDSLPLPFPIIPSGHYQGDRITSAGRVLTGSSVSLSFNQYVELQPGFEVEATGSFETQIKVCQCQ